MLSHFSQVQLFTTLRTCQAPLSMGFSRQEYWSEKKKKRILEWVAKPSSRASSQPRDQTCISFISDIGRQFLYTSAVWEAL